MTYQIRDQVRIDGEPWDLLLHTGSDESPFDPLRLGLQPFWASSACWRGYLCCYSVGQDFRIHSMKINILPWKLRLIRWRPPIPNILFFDTDFLWHYICRFRVNYSGWLLIGKDFKMQRAGEPEHFALRYQRLMEVEIDAGHIIGTEDLTETRQQLVNAVRAMPQPNQQRPIEDYSLRSYAIDKFIHDKLLFRYQQEPLDPRPILEA